MFHHSAPADNRAQIFGIYLTSLIDLLTHTKHNLFVSNNLDQI